MADRLRLEDDQNGAAELGPEHAETEEEEDS
jgi:hypothetical protein